MFLLQIAMVSKYLLLLLYFYGFNRKDVEGAVNKTTHLGNLVDIRINIVDACNSHQTLTDSTRSVDNTLSDFASESCDRLLEENWYRLKDDGNIPTVCPAILRCGSTGPVWLNGSLPTIRNQEVTLKACQAGFTKCCQFEWQVKVKNCGTFNTYNLVPTDVCPGRYCIEGTAAPCQPGWGSDTGFQPCTQLNITFTVKPQVQAYIPTFSTESDENELAFECRTSMPYSYRKYFFDIEWFVNDAKVNINKSRIEYNLLKVKGTLHRKDWDPELNAKIGFHVKCAIRARAYREAPPTEYQNSDVFFAGPQLKSSSIDVYLNRTKETKIEIISTVPIACKQLGSTRLCNILIELYSFDHQFPKSPAHCNQSLLNQKPKPSACDFDFDGNKWRYYQSMPVSLLSDQTSRNSYRAIVQLRAVSGTDTLWGNVFLPEMKINVFKERRATGECSSHGDPSIRTVDGESFISTVKGEFILYKLKSKPIQINSLQSDRRTNCAVAIRASSDMFMVYGCENPNKWIIRRSNCNEHNQYLEVFERSLGKQFEVELPTGTRVTIAIMGSYLNIVIKPSFNDWEQVEGICGTYNGRKSDDLTDRSGRIVRKSEFIQSWSVQPLESLFRAKDRQEIIKKEFVYCSCANYTVEQKTECRWQESLPVCQPLNWGQKKCLVKGKREAIDDIEIDAPENIVAFVSTNATDDWKNGWNESTAREKCESVLRSSGLYEVCESLSSVNNKDNIEACIADIRISGTELYLDTVKERLQTECVSELRFNVSLWSTNTSSDSNIAEMVFSHDCPNDCSSAGQCLNGVCQCNHSYTGDDCSVNLDRPPVLFDTSKESLCDLTKRPCTSISLFGDGFYQSGTITCQLREAMFSGSKIVEGNKTVTENGDLESFGEVKCPLRKIARRKRRSTNTVQDAEAILVSVSMNGKNYSLPVPIVLYESSYQSCTLSNNVIKCDLRKDICIVNGNYYDAEHPYCAPKDVTQQKQNSLILIVGGLIGGVCFLIVVVLVVFKIYRHKKLSNTKGKETKGFSMEAVGKY